MVQRKVLNKLGIQDDCITIENRLANLRPSSLQYQDIKNRGVDFKKKMKKPGSTKHVEFENRRSPNLPNFMKSTSSSVARKEQSRVSTKSPQTRHVSSHLQGKNLNYSSKTREGSTTKAEKTLFRAGSLKMKRILIVTPSFKPGRASIRKRVRVLLCENSDVARATCSSTLKGYKLPDYLVLNPGGTELEGTSVIKVCPYTYCSLNGHHHDPFPPLNSFISATRRMLKNQRNLQFGCSSPRRESPVGDDEKFDEELVNRGDFGTSTAFPLTQEEPNEFSVEDYSAGEEHAPTTYFMLTVHTRDEITAQDYEQVEETVSDGLICEDINCHEHLDEDRDETKSKDTCADAYPEGKIPEEISLLPLFEDESNLGNFTPRIDFATESMSTVHSYELDSEISDTDWKGNYSALYPDSDCESLAKEEREIDLDGWKDESVHDSIVNESVDCIGSCCDKIQANDDSQETFSEDSLNADALSSKDDCESVISVHYLDGLNNSKTSATTEVPKEEPEANYKNKCEFSFVVNQNRERISQIGAGPSSNLVIEEETSFGNLNFECLRDENVIAVTGEGDTDILKVLVKEMVTSGGKATTDNMTDVDVSVQTSSDEGLQISAEKNFESLKPMSLTAESHSKETETNSPKAVAIVFHQIKEDNSDKPNKPDQAAAINKVDRGILTHNQLRDQFNSERVVFAIGKGKRSTEDSDEEGRFNPREPNFLPLEEEPETEKVDLRHYELDEKKNAEEWMVDYALRQTVTKLDPARKKKVELLVEAFEKVMPMIKCEHSHSSAFDHARSIQTCN